VLGFAAVVFLPRSLNQPEAKPGAAEPKPLPGIVVRASYPGASARVVADTIAAPIEQQVNGVEGLKYMSSESTDDGTYTLTITFEHGTDLNIAQVLVQNRVALAQPVLPDVVQRIGLVVKKKSGDVALFVSVSSDGRYDTLYLSNYARLHVRDELARLAGVGEILPFGQRETCVLLDIDPDRLAARGLTVSDVVRAVEGQNLQVAAGQVGVQPGVAKGSVAVLLKRSGRAADPEEIGTLVLKTDAEGRKTQLNDVGRLKIIGVESSGVARLNGRVVVVLGIAPAAEAPPSEVMAAVKTELAGLRERLPEGVRLDAIFDASPGREGLPGEANQEYLRLEVTLPDAASRERTSQVLTKCEQILARVKEVQDVLTVTGPPVAAGANQGCLLVRLGPVGGEEPKRTRVATRIRTRVNEEISEAIVRVCEGTGPGHLSPEAYAVAVAVHGPDETTVRQLAHSLSQRLQEGDRLVDVGSTRSTSPTPKLVVEIDRTQAGSRGVALDDIFKTIQAMLGTAYLTDFNRFARSRKLEVRLDGQFGTHVEDVKRLRVRNAQGRMVPLGALLRITQQEGPQAVHRFNAEPMCLVTANLGPDVSPAQARALCEAVAEEVLPRGYRLSWMNGPPAE
jgi:multidrug efflux pump subunit AcrB